MNTYKVNNSIRIMYQALGGQAGLTDVTATVYNPSNSLFTTVVLTELLPGLYSGTFTPNVVGRWHVRITSSSSPENTTAEFYEVTNEDFFPATIIQDNSVYRLAVDVKANTDIPSVINVSELIKLGKVYSTAFTVNMTTAGVDNPLYLLKNPSGNNKSVFIYSMRFGVDVENNYANFIIWASPTVTNDGTVQPIHNRSIGGGFPASSMESYILPTVTSEGDQLENIEVASNSNSINNADNFILEIKPNNSILVTGDPKSNNRNAVVTIIWAELDI